MSTSDVLSRVQATLPDARVSVDGAYITISLCAQSWLFSPAGIERFLREYQPSPDTALTVILTRYCSSHF